MPARRKYLVPKGLKPIKRRLATGEAKVYWYHRATGKRLQHDPESAEGHLEIARLDREAEGTKAVSEAAAGSYGDLWNAYIQSPEWRGLKPRTRSDYQAVRDWLGDAAKAQPVRAWNTSDIYKLRDKAARQRGRRFGNYVVQVLSLTIEWGRKRDRVGTNVAYDVDKIAKPKSERKVNRAWSNAEVEAFARAAPFQVLVPFSLALFCGMRQGDALMVTWSAIKDGEIEWTAGKNGEECVAAVSGVFGAIIEEARQRRGDAVQIAVTAYGSPWTASGFRASFFKLVRKLQLAGALRPGCTFHGLRHTIATIARDGGESESRVAAGIGDRSAAMAAIYGRDADRADARASVLGSIQKRFANIEWKTGLENGLSRPARKSAKVLKL